MDYDDEARELPDPGGFQAETGIEVKYTEDINDNDEYYGKIQAQLSDGQDIGQDIVVFTDWMAARMIRQGYAQKLDAANIPNKGNILANLADVDFDPGREYSLPLAVRLRRHRLEQGEGRRRPAGRVDDLLDDPTSRAGSRSSPRCATPSA